MKKYFKYPRTFHVSWSAGLQNDDKMHHAMEIFQGKEVVVTEKMDGENTNLYRDFYHSRSIDSGNNEHPKLKASRAWAKRLHGEIKFDIPVSWRVCGENMYALHSIPYNHLSSYFYTFGIWRGFECLSWDETMEWTSLLNLQVVPVLYEGIYDEDLIKSLYQEYDANGDPMEGYVIRFRDSFFFDADQDDFCPYFAKYVRKGHVQTDQHWLDKPLVPNKLIRDSK